MKTLIFGKNKEEAERVLKRKKSYEDLTQTYKSHINQLNELSDLFELANEENNQQVLNEVNSKIKDLKLK